MPKGITNDPAVRAAKARLNDAKRRHRCALLFFHAETTEMNCYVSTKAAKEVLKAAEELAGARADAGYKVGS